MAAMTSGENTQYAKPRTRGLLFHYKKNTLKLASIFFGKSIQKHPDSVCENGVKNEQNVRAYFMPSHWIRS